MKKLLIGVGVMSVLLGCHSGVSVTAGPQVEEDRVVTTFTNVIVDGAMNLFITQDSSYVIRVEAPENLMEHIKTEVSGSDLKIYEDHNHVVHTRAINVFISQAAIDRIELNGSGNIEANNIVSTNFDLELNGSGNIFLNIATTNLEVDLRGSGNIDITGSTTDLSVEIVGSGDLDVRNIPTTNAIVEVDGSGNVSLDVSNSLNAEIEGSGNIYYWGSPTTVVTNVTGSGQVIDMN